MGDTSEITNGCLTHYDSRHIQVRADFMGLCQYNRDEYKDRRKKEPNQECMAKILRLLETLTDHAKAEWKLKTMKAEEKGLAKPKEPERYPIELSNGVIVRLIYSTFGESTVRNSLSYLLEIGYIGYSQEKKNDRPRIWLEQERIQAHLKLQAQVILAGYEFRPPHYQGAISYPDDAISNPRTPISYPDPPKTDPSGCESTDNNIDNKDDISHKTDEKEIVATSAEDRNAPAANVHDFTEWKRKTDPRIAALKIGETNGRNDRLANSHQLPTSADNIHSRQDIRSALPEEIKDDVSGSHADIGNDSDVPTVKLAAVKIGASNGLLPVRSALPGVPNSNPVHPDEHGLVAERHDLIAQTPAAGAAIPPSSGVSAQASRDGTYSTPAQRSGGSSPTGIPASPGAVQEDRPPMALTAKQIEKQLERRQEEIFAIYEAKIGRKPSHSKANKDGAKLLAQDDVSDEDIKTTIDEILKDSFLAKNLNLTFVHSKLDALARKPIPIQQNGKAPARDENIGVSGLPRFQRREVKYG